MMKRVFLSLALGLAAIQAPAVSAELRIGLSAAPTSMDPQFHVVGQNSAMAIVQAQAQFANATTDLFRAKIQAVDLARRLDVGNVDRDMKAGENNQGASTAAMKQRVDATISAAQSAGTQAAAALNGLRGSAAVGASESL